MYFNAKPLFWNLIANVFTATVEERIFHLLQCPWLSFIYQNMHALGHCVRQYSFRPIWTKKERDNIASGIEHCDVIHRAVSAPLLHLLVLLVFAFVQSTCFKPISLALIQFHDNLFLIFLAKYLLFAREWFIERACLAFTDVQSVHHSFEYIRQWQSWGCI